MSNILVAVDFSSVTAATADTAGRVARMLRTDLHLVHVLTPDPSHVGGDFGFTFNDGAAEPARQELEHLAARLRAEDAIVHAHLLRGQTCHAIVQEAAAVDAHLIVMGSHGHSAVYDLLVGSVSEGVLRHTVLPVLLVPGRTGDAPDAALPQRFGRILVAIDLSTVTEAMLREASTFARAGGAQVHLLHVLPRSDAGDDASKRPREDRDVEQQIEHLADRLRKEGIETTSSCAVGDPVDVVLERAVAADLLVVGSHGHGAVYDLLVGSVSEGILRKARCPTLVIPDPQRRTGSPAPDKADATDSGATSGT